MVSILCLEHFQPLQMWGIPPPCFRVPAEFCLICQQSYACSPLEPYISLPFFQVERYTISGLHTSPVTAIEWSMNGMKMFSGDKSGLVVLTEIDFYMVSISNITNDVCTVQVLGRYWQGQKFFLLFTLSRLALSPHKPPIHCI
jgi:hypothetical protein